MLPQQCMWVANRLYQCQGTRPDLLLYCPNLCERTLTAIHATPHLCSDFQGSFRPFWTRAFACHGCENVPGSLCLLRFTRRRVLRIALALKLSFYRCWSKACDADGLTEDAVPDAVVARKRKAGFVFGDPGESCCGL